jgi:hypothetical protein
VLERLFKKIFISIIPAEDGYAVMCVVAKNKNILSKEQQHFIGDVPSNTMNRYIQSKIDSSPFFYISTLNLYANQGAYKGCSRPALHFRNDDVVGVQTVYRNDEWTQYASQDELHRLKLRYAEVGLDFIFSPFSMIEHYFADKIKNAFALYAFGMPGVFAIAIFDGGQLEYAHYYTADNGLQKTEDDMSLSSMDFSSPVMEKETQDDRTISLDDIEDLEDLDLLDDLDSFDDIANLDDLDEVSEFSEDVLTPEEIRQEKENDPSASKHAIDGSGEEYERFEFIQKTLQRFYTSDQCANRFVETVCIADAGKGGDELKRYLEEELFLNVLVRRVNVCEGINALALAEEESL